jgi:hypothetical protein
LPRPGDKQANSKSGFLHGCPPARPARTAIGNERRPPRPAEEGRHLDFFCGMPLPRSSIFLDVCESLRSFQPRASISRVSRFLAVRTALGPSVSLSLAQTREHWPRQTLSFFFLSPIISFCCQTHIDNIFVLYTPPPSPHAYSNNPSSQTTSSSQLPEIASPEPLLARGPSQSWRAVGCHSCRSRQKRRRRRVPPRPAP